MIRPVLTAAASLSLALLAASPVTAAPCKDAKGKFTKCPPAAAKDAKGKFAKCGSPGAKPM